MLDEGTPVGGEGLLAEQVSRRRQDDSNDGLVPWCWVLVVCVHVRESLYSPNSHAQTQNDLYPSSSQSISERQPITYRQGEYRVDQSFVTLCTGTVPSKAGIRRDPSAAGYGICAWRDDIPNSIVLLCSFNWRVFVELAFACYADDRRVGWFRPLAKARCVDNVVTLHV